MEFKANLSFEYGGMDLIDKNASTLYSYSSVQIGSCLIPITTRIIFKNRLGFKVTMPPLSKHNRICALGVNLTFLFENHNNGKGNNRLYRLYWNQLAPDGIMLSYHILVLKFMITSINGNVIFLSAPYLSSKSHFYQ